MITVHTAIIIIVNVYTYIIIREPMSCTLVIKVSVLDKNRYARSMFRVARMRHSIYTLLKRIIRTRLKADLQYENIPIPVCTSRGRARDSDTIITEGATCKELRAAVFSRKLMRVMSLSKVMCTLIVHQLPDRRLLNLNG